MQDTATGVQTETATRQRSEDREGTLELGSGPLKEKARYVRIIARNIAKIPEGQRAAGRPAWLFVSEIVINNKGVK